MPYSEREKAPLLSHPPVPPSATLPSYPSDYPPPSEHGITVQYYGHDITSSSSSQARAARVKPTFSWSNLAWSTVRWLLYLTFLLTFVMALYLTVTYRNAPCERPLQWLTGVVGVTGMVWLLVIPYQVQLEEHAPPTWELCCIRTTWALRMACFGTLLTVNSLGSRWVFGQMDGEQPLCPRPLYDFAFVILIGWWVVMGVGSLVLCGIVTVLCVAFLR